MGKHRMLRSRRVRWGALAVLGLVGWPVIGATPIVALDLVPALEPRIEITIRDFKYVRTKMESIRAGAPMLFVVPAQARRPERRSASHRSPATPPAPGRREHPSALFVISTFCVFPCPTSSV